MKVKITNLSKEINGSVVLNDVNLELESGAVYGLLGKNGSGKTMLMRADHRKGPVFPPERGDDFGNPGLPTGQNRV